MTLDTLESCIQPNKTTDRWGIQRQCVSSFRGKAIREWSSKLYEQVAKARKNDVSQRVEAHAGDQRSSNNQSPQMSDDPIKVLKIRFAKGEISKEQYEERRKMIES